MKEIPDEILDIIFNEEIEEINWKQTKTLFKFCVVNYGFFRTISYVVPETIRYMLKLINCD